MVSSVASQSLYRSDHCGAEIEPCLLFFFELIYIFDNCCNVLLQLLSHITMLGDETADELVEFVKSEVQTELKSRTDTFLIKEDKIGIINRIRRAKIETIIWIVGIGVLQFILTFLQRISCDYYEASR